MSIGAVSAYGAVSALHFRPYVYNTNTLSAYSMNKLSRISDNVLDRKTDYSDLADESLNVNPLKKGQTLDFQGILDMQMRRGQNNAARIMRLTESAQGTEETEQKTGSVATRTGFHAEEAQADETVTEVSTAETANAGGDTISYQMRQALQAYEMFMTA